MINFSFIKRYFIFLSQKNSFNLVLGTFTILIVSIFGIFPLSYNIYKNISLSSELNKYISYSKEKIDFLNNAQQELIQLKTPLRYYRSYMPDNPMLSNYLVMLDSIFTYNGFFTENISTLIEEDTKIIQIEALIYGYGDLSNLVQEIESQNRVTNIKTIHLKTIKNRLSTKLVLEISYK